MRYADIFLMIMRRYIASAIIPFDFLHASVSMFLDETCSFLFLLLRKCLSLRVSSLKRWSWCYMLFVILFVIFLCYFVSFYIFFLLLCLLSGIRFCLRIYIAMMRITNVMMISQYSYESRTWRWSDWQQGGDGPSCCRCLVYALFSIHLVDLLNIVVLHIVFSLYSMVRTAYYPHSWYPFDVDQGSGFRSRVSEVLGFTSIYKMKEAVNNEHRHFGDFPKLTSCVRIMYNHPFAPYFIDSSTCTGTVLLNRLAISDFRARISSVSVQERSHYCTLYQYGIGQMYPAQTAILSEPRLAGKWFRLLDFHMVF